MRVLFSMRHTGALRNFAATRQALAGRNHQIHLVFGHRDKEGDERLLSKLTSDFPNITVGSDSTVSVQVTSPDGRLRGGNGLLDADGAAVVVHARPDDYRTNPSGNAGDRIACGVVSS